MLSPNGVAFADGRDIEEALSTDATRVETSDAVVPGIELAEVVKDLSEAVVVMVGCVLLEVYASVEDVLACCESKVVDVSLVTGVKAVPVEKVLAGWEVMKVDTIGKVGVDIGLFTGSEEANSGSIAVGEWPIGTGVGFGAVVMMGGCRSPS